MQELLSPKVDFVFKRIFGDEKQPEILISFLNSVLKHEEPIKSVVINNNDLDRKYIFDKLSRMDIRATTDKDEIINIEIQIKNEHNMDKRSIYHLARMYGSQLNVADHYQSLVRTVCINIINFNFFDNERYHNVYRFLNLYDHTQLTDIAEIHFIELRKLNLPKGHMHASMLEKWVDFINTPQNFYTKVFAVEEKTETEIDAAVKKLQFMSLNKEDRQFYEQRHLAILDHNTAIFNAENRGIEQGIEQGIELGKEQGIQLGIEQGIEKGIEKGKEDEKLEIARNLLDVLDNETISTKTGLTIEQVQSLRK